MLEPAQCPQPRMNRKALFVMFVEDFVLLHIGGDHAGEGTLILNESVSFRSLLLSTLHEFEEYLIDVPLEFAITLL